MLEETANMTIIAPPPIEVKEDVVIAMDDHFDNEDPVRVIEKARALDPKTRHERTRMTVNDKGELTANQKNVNPDARLSFAEA